MNDEKKKDIELNQYYTIPYHQDDEISIVDIYHVLAKNKMMIVIITLLITFLGSVYATLKPDVFSYSTAIQIGSIVVAGERKPIAEIAAVETKIKELYIPLVLDEYYRANPDQPKNILINVKVPKGSDIIYIEGKSTDKIAQLYISLINKISALTLSDLNQKTDIYKATLNVQVTDATKRLTILDSDQAKTNQRIEDFDKTFKSSPTANIGISSVVITELFSQIQEITSQKYALEGLITNKKSELDLVDETRSVYPPKKSIDPVGIGKILLITASIFTGLFLGLFSAFLVNFVAKIKHQLDSSIA